MENVDPSTGRTYYANVVTQVRLFKEIDSDIISVLVHMLVLEFLTQGVKFSCLNCTNNVYKSW